MSQRQHDAWPKKRWQQPSSDGSSFAIPVAIPGRPLLQPTNVVTTATAHQCFRQNMSDIGTHPPGRLIRRASSMPGINWPPPLPRRCALLVHAMQLVDATIAPIGRVCVHARAEFCTSRGWFGSS
jgi:hypothetical protein